MQKIYYRSTVRGAEDDLETAPKHLYYGFTERIPTKCLTRNIDADLARSALKIKEFLGPFKLHDGTEVEPVPGLPVERYEIYDFATDDILIMWRVPVREMPRKS